MRRMGRAISSSKLLSTGATVASSAGVTSRAVAIVAGAANVSIALAISISMRHRAVTTLCAHLQSRLSAVPGVMPYCNSALPTLTCTTRSTGLERVDWATRYRDVWKADVERRHEAWGGAPRLCQAGGGVPTSGNGDITIPPPQLLFESVAISHSPLFKEAHSHEHPPGTASSSMHLMITALLSASKTLAMTSRQQTPAVARHGDDWQNERAQNTSMTRGTR